MQEMYWGGGISSEIFARKSPKKTTREDLQVNDVMVCDKSIRGGIQKKKFGRPDEVQVYK